MSRVEDRDAIERGAVSTAGAGPSTRRWVTSAIVAALLVAIAIHFSTRREELATIGRVSVPILLVTGLLQFLSQLCLNGSFLLPLRSCVTRLGFWELQLVRSGGLLAGSLVPVAGGLAVRLAYLKGRGLTYLDFAWATLLSNVLALVAAALLAAAATAGLWATTGPPPVPIVVASAVVLAASAAVLAAFEVAPRLTRGARLARWRALSTMRSLRTTDRRMAASVFVLSLLRHLLNFATFGLLTQSLSGAPRDFLAGGLMYVLTSPLRMVNIIPGNLGIVEWAVALVGKTLALDIALGLLAALAFRGVGLAGQGLAVLVGSAWLGATWRR
jgi:hypothetical protein